jgi:predicted amidohydrolase
MGTVRVATAQLKGEKYSTLEELVEYLSNFIQQNHPVDILVLPEYSILPLLKEEKSVSRTKVRDYYDKVFPALEPRMLDYFKQLSTEFSVNILIGSHWTLIKGLPYNAAYFFMPGEEVLVYPKCKPTPPEEAMGMVPGEKPGLVTLQNGVKIGILICFDVEFPELARNLAFQGADILLVPSLTLNNRGAARVEICARSRAIENQLYVVSSTNQAYLDFPVEKPIRGVGRVGIFGPADNKTRLSDGVVVQAAKDGDVILLAELNLDVLQESRFKSEAPLRKNV